MGVQRAQAPLDERLWTLYASHPNRRVREQIIQHYRPLALAVLKQMGHGGDEDMLQVAMLGLVHAVDRFDPASGFRFSTFAVPTIMGEIKRYLRDHSRLVRPPRSLHDLYAAIVSKERELAVRMGRAPSLPEIAEALGVKLEQVVEALAIEETCSPYSLHGFMPSMEYDQLVPIEEALGGEDPELARADTRIAWEQVLDTLDPSLRDVIELRYYQELSQKDAARHLGVSQMQVSRLERRALDSLRRQESIIRSIEEMPLPGERQQAAGGSPQTAGGRRQAAGGRGQADVRNGVNVVQ